MAPSTTLGPVYCTINGEEMDITGFKNISLEPETTYEYCVVKDTGKYYPSYKAFIKKHCSHRLSDWQENQPPLKDRVYKIITNAQHESEKGVTIYVIEDMDTEQIYLIGGDGIVKYNQCTGLYNTTITVDDAVGLDYCHHDTLTTTKCEELYNKYALGKWDLPIIRKGESEMRNEVLELYAERENNKIADRFKKMKEEEYNNFEAVKRYNELINTFKASLAELVDEYKNEEPKIFVQTVYENHFGYEINPYLERQIAEKFREDYEKDKKELNDKIAEIKAVLSLSNDVEYQKNVLIEYGILNKKGVMVNE